MSFSLSLISLFRRLFVSFPQARYVLPCSLSVGTVNYKRSFVRSDHFILNSVTECRGNPKRVRTCSLHFCQNDDVNRFAAICWPTLQIAVQDEELVESGVQQFRIDVLPKLAGDARSLH